MGPGTMLLLLLCTKPQELLKKFTRIFAKIAFKSQT